MPPPPPGGPDMNGPGKDGRPEHHGRHGGPRGGMKGPMMGLGKADADGDRAVTRAEFVTAALQRFDAVDTDKDGKITPRNAAPRVTGCAASGRPARTTAGTHAARLTRRRRPRRSNRSPPERPAGKGME